MKTFDIGLATSQTGNGILMFVSDRELSGTVAINQPTPIISSNAVEIFAILLRKMLPAKSAASAKNQFTATGIAACWHG
jgi:hypothetical protein